MSAQPIPVMPEIIQGGMGVYISTPFLANAVSLNGALGTVSGVAPERVLARLLGKGDPGGHYRRALAHFPFPDVAQQVIDTYFVEVGDTHEGKAKNAPLFTVDPPPALIALTICANFAFVYLAKEGHNNPVSINYLEKIALPHLYSLTGALLADVDFVTMGAGMPLQIPEVIDDLVSGRTAHYRVPVAGTTITSHTMSFDPTDFFGKKLPSLKKPGFIPIIASNLLADIFMKKLPQGSVYGFVVEEPTAGGHNARPRKGGVYGPKDEVDYAEITKLDLPFWIGGSKASSNGLRWARSVGAVGIQAGSIFALSDESGMKPDIRREIRRHGFTGTLEVRTDMRASPTGFPFKVVTLQGSLSEEEVHLARQKFCDQGALRTLFEDRDGSIGYRCPGEPFSAYLRKGGRVEETEGVRCMCNGLLATAGLGDGTEAPLVTLGDDVDFLQSLMNDPEDSYGVIEALAYLRA